MSDQSIICPDRCHQNGTLFCPPISSILPCSCKKFYTSPTCDRRLDVCLAESPCQNRGSCQNRYIDFENIDQSGFVCLCKSGYGGDRCQSAVGWPHGDEAAIACRSLKEMGCIAVIILLSISILENLISRDYAPLSLLKLNADLALLAAHVVIALARDPVTLHLDAFGCKIAAVLNYFFHTAFFVFVEIESRHAYYYLTGVLVQKNCWGYDLSPFFWLGIGWAYTGAISILAVLFSFDRLANGWTCWIDYGSISLRWILLMLVPCWSTLLNFEASGTDSRYRINRFIDQSIDKDLSIKANMARDSVPFILAASIWAYVVSSWTSYRPEWHWAVLALPINVTAAVSILFWHTLSNRYVINFILKIWRKVKKPVGAF